MMGTNTIESVLTSVFDRMGEKGQAAINRPEFMAILRQVVENAKKSSDLASDLPKVAGLITKFAEKPATLCLASAHTNSFTTFNLCHTTAPAINSPVPSHQPIPDISPVKTTSYGMIGG